MSFYGQITAPELAQWLKYLEWSKEFPDYPPNFVPPVILHADYVPPFRGTKEVASTSVAIGLAIIVVVSRLLARGLRAPRRLGWDDYFILAALIASIGYAIVGIAAVENGCVGYHSYDCSPRKLSLGWLYRFTGLMFYISASMLIKVSIALFCRRLSPPTMFVYRHIVNLTIFFIGLTFLTSLFLSIFYCTPVKAGWDLNVRVQKTTKCITEWKLIFGFGILYSLADVWLIILPAWLVAGLSIRKRSRVGLVLVFSMGSIATISSILKLVVTKRAYDTFDPSWNFIDILIYSELEICFGLMSASLPALSFLLVSLFSRCYERTTQKPKSSNNLHSAATTLAADTPPFWLSEQETQHNALDNHSIKVYGQVDVVENTHTSAVKEQLNRGSKLYPPVVSDGFFWRSTNPSDSSVASYEESLDGSERSSPVDERNAHPAAARGFSTQRRPERAITRGEQLVDDDASIELVIQAPETSEYT